MNGRWSITVENMDTGHRFSVVRSGDLDQLMGDLTTDLGGYTVTDAEKLP